MLELICGLPKSGKTYSLFKTIPRGKALLFISNEETDSFISNLLALNQDADVMRITSYKLDDIYKQLSDYPFEVVAIDSLNQLVESNVDQCKSWEEILKVLANNITVPIYATLNLVKSN
jgi:predicted ATP-dependent serine protease